MQGGILLQPPGELIPVMNQHRPMPDHLLIEFRKRLQQSGAFLRIPEYPDFLLLGPGIAGEGRGISGTELAQGVIQEPPPGGGALPYQKQVFRPE